MTHDELPSHSPYGKRDRVGMHWLAPGKWILVSEKPGDLAVKSYTDEQQALRDLADIKAERGIV